MDTFWWIFLSGVLMSVIALVGSATLLLNQATLDRIIMPLVAFAAGSLLGGAFFHMLPAAILAAPGDPAVAPGPGGHIQSTSVGWQAGQTSRHKRGGRGTSLWFSGQT